MGNLSYTVRRDEGIAPYEMLQGVVFLPDGTMWAPWSAAEQVPLGCILPYERI